MKKTQTTGQAPALKFLLPLLAIALAALNMRAAVTGLSPLIPTIQQQLGLNNTLVGLIGMIPTAMFGLAALATPKILQRFTLIQALILALIITGCGLLIRVWGNPLTLFAGSMLALLQIGMLNAMMPLAVRLLFPQKVHLVSIWYLVFMQIGMAAAPLLTVQAAAHPVFATLTMQPWQYALALLALPAFAAGCLWIPLLKLHHHTNQNKQQAKLRVGRTKIGFSLAVMFGFTSFATYGLMMFLPAMYLDGGASPTFAATMLALWSGIGLVLALLGPWIAGRFADPFWIIVGFQIMFAVGVTGMALAPMKLPVLWAILAGLGPCAFPVGLTLINVRAKTMAGATALSAYGQGLGYTYACLGPLLFGLIRNHTTGWTYPLLVCLTAMVLVTFAAWFCTRAEYVEDQLARTTKN